MRDIEQGKCFSADGWLTVKQEENGFPVVYQARDEIPRDIDIATLANMLCVVWPFESDGEDGLPGDEVVARQKVFEQALEEISDASDSSCLMLKLTGKSKKEWLWYVADPARWQEQAALALEAEEAFPIKITCYDGEEWKVYKHIRDGMNALTKEGS